MNEEETIGASNLPIRFSMMEDLHEGFGISAQVFVSPVSGKATPRVLNVFGQTVPLSIYSSPRYVSFPSTISLGNIFAPNSYSCTTWQVFEQSSPFAAVLHSSVIGASVSIA